MIWMGAENHLSEPIIRTNEYLNSSSSLSAAAIKPIHFSKLLFYLFIKNSSTGETLFPAIFHHHNAHYFLHAMDGIIKCIVRMLW